MRDKVRLVVFLAVFDNVGYMLSFALNNFLISYYEDNKILDISELFNFAKVVNVREIPFRLLCFAPTYVIFSLNYFNLKHSRLVNIMFYILMYLFSALCFTVFYVYSTYYATYYSISYYLIAVAMLLICLALYHRIYPSNR